MPAPQIDPEPLVPVTGGSLVATGETVPANFTVQAWLSAPSNTSRPANLTASLTPSVKAALSTGVYAIGEDLRSVLLVGGADLTLDWVNATGAACNAGAGSWTVTGCHAERFPCPPGRRQRHRIAHILLPAWEGMVV